MKKIDLKCLNFKLLEINVIDQLLVLEEHLQKIKIKCSQNLVEVYLVLFKIQTQPLLEIKTMSSKEA